MLSENLNLILYFALINLLIAITFHLFSFNYVMKTRCNWTNSIEKKFFRLDDEFLAANTGILLVFPVLNGKFEKNYMK
jgi:hypothetical protein